MTTPIQPISLLDVQNEFGGATPISFNEYYAGAGRVQNPPPTSQYQLDGGILAGGRISLGNFRGLSAITQQPEFLAARVHAQLDRQLGVRWYLSNGYITSVSSTSDFSIRWMQIFRLPTTDQLVAGSSARLVVTQSMRRNGALGTVQAAPLQMTTTLTHNANISEPYIDWLWNDDVGSNRVVFLMEIYITLSFGAASNPGAYTGPLAYGAVGNSTPYNGGGPPYQAWGNFEYQQDFSDPLNLGYHASQEAQPTYPYLPTYITPVTPGGGDSGGGTG